MTKQLMPKAVLNWINEVIPFPGPTLYHRKTFSCPCPMPATGDARPDAHTTHTLPSGEPSVGNAPNSPSTPGAGWGATVR